MPRIGTFLAAILLVLATSALATGVSVATDYSTIKMTSCTRGTVYAYAENRDGAPATLSISAAYGRLAGSVQTPIQNIPGYQGRGSQVYVYSNECFKGSEDVTIYFQVCRDAACQTLSKVVRVNVEPCIGCNSYIEQYLPPVPNYQPAPATCIGNSCGQALSSTLYFENAFDPVAERVEISLDKDKYAVTAGEQGDFDVTIDNQGAPVTLDLGLEGFPQELGAQLQDSVVGLDRGQNKVVVLAINPQADLTGRYCLAITASRRGYELDRKAVCFDVFDGVAAKVSAPQEVSISRCENNASYGITIENAGVAPNAFTLQGDQPAAEFSRPAVVLEPGQTATVDVLLDTALLPPDSQVTVNATGDRVNEITGKRFSQSVTTKVLVSECLANSMLNATANGGLLTLVETVSNPSDTEVLEGVTATIQGLPAGYAVIQKEPAGIAIPPKASGKLTVFVQAPSDAATANGVLVVKTASGRILYQRPVTVNALAGDGGSITGFLTKAAADNPLLAAIAVFGAALIALLLFGKPTTRKNSQSATQAKASN